MNNPNVTKMVVHGVTVSLSNGSVSSQLPPNPAMMRGWNAKIAYNNNGLESTTIDGGAQNLVMWHQLTLEAQEALNDKHSFGNAQVPFNDANFLRYLDASWPFSRDALKKA
ncbi:putative necrosis inducing protein [Plasmopara halstedii]